MCYDHSYKSLSALKADSPLIVIGVVTTQRVGFGRNP